MTKCLKHLSIAILFVVTAVSASTLLQSNASAAPVVHPLLQRADPQRIVDTDIPREWMMLVHEQVSQQQIDLPSTTRILGYMNLALYAVTLPEQMATQPNLRNTLPTLPQQNPRLTYEAALVATGVLATVADQLLLDVVRTNGSPRAAAQAVANLRSRQLRARLSNVERETVERSLMYGEEIGAMVLEWAATDGYANLSTQVFSIPIGGDTYWQATEPNSSPVQPYWGSLRSFTQSDLSRCTRPLRLAFSTFPGSTFHMQAMEVYNLSQEQSTTHTEIVHFWGNEARQKRGRTQPTPEGNIATHWMLIAGTVTDKLGLSLAEMAELYWQMSASMADVTIASWEQQYATFLMRPETYIQRYIDEDWQPLQQTPNSPGYPSTTAAISASAAQILSSHLGTMDFVDVYGIVNGRAVRRTYTTFEGAAYESAIAQIYGGIHFRTGIEAGLRQGKCVARMFSHS